MFILNSRVRCIQYKWQHQALYWMFHDFSQVLHLYAKNAHKNQCWVTMQIQKCCFLFSFQQLWWFFKVEIANRLLLYTRNSYKSLFDTIFSNYWMRIDKISGPIVRKLERMVYHVVCSMSWTPPIKPGNLLTILATIYVRTVSFLHRLYIFCWTGLNGFWAVWNDQEHCMLYFCPDQQGTNESNVPKLKRLKYRFWTSKKCNSVELNSFTP